VLTKKTIPLPHLDRHRELLSNRRSESGLTYDQLAAISGVGRRTIVSVESGKSPGSMETWFRLATALEVGFDELFKAATGISTNVVLDTDGPTPVLVTRPELALGITSDDPNALFPDGTRPDLLARSSSSSTSTQTDAPAS